MMNNFFEEILFRHFWEDIKRWAIESHIKILKEINEEIEVPSDAFVYLIEERGRIYEQMEVYVQSYPNGDSQQTRLKVVEQEVNISDIPLKILQQLQEKRELKVLQFSGNNQHD